jgi:integrase
MPSKLPQPVSKEEFDKILDYSKKLLEKHWHPRKETYSERGKKIQQYLVAIVLAYGSGMRISEIVGLDKTYNYKYKGSDKTQTSKIPLLTPDRIENNYIRVIGAKGGKDRQVPLPIALFKKAGINRKEFISLLPLTVKRGSIQKFTKETGQKVLNKQISFHKLRHGFASFMVGKVELHELQRLMGHSRLDTTGIYLHTNPEKILAKYEEIEW